MMTSHNTDTTRADKPVISYYQANNEWLWMLEGSQTAQADSVATFLRGQVAQQGISTKAFFLDDIDRDMECFRTMKFDGVNMPEVMARLEWNLSKAYMRFATGERYGFTEPKRIFSKGVFAIPVESPDSASVR